MAPSKKFAPQRKTNSLRIGPLALAVTGTVAVAVIVAAFLFIPLLLAFITMLLFGVLHAEVALGIPAFGYWASFWITLAWAYAASFFRGNSSS